MYTQLTEIHRRPDVFSAYTAEKLWTEPHIAKQMLMFHLSEDTALASRPVVAIDRVVDWMDQCFGLAGKSVCDLGCGPGLYASRYAERGAIVHGIDFSANSIGYAQEHAPENGEPIAYRVDNYLTAELPAQQDLVTLIYCDLCPLSPAQRRALLAKIRDALAPGGKFVFDVFSMQAFAAVREGVSFGRNYMDGFWSARDYFAFQLTFRYDDAGVSLDRYLVIEEGRSWDVYNWLQYFSAESIRAELTQAGFDTVEIVEGFGVDRADTATFGIVAGA